MLFDLHYASLSPDWQRIDRYGRRIPYIMRNPKSFVRLDAWGVALYATAVIRSFKDRETEKIFGRLHSRRLPNDIQPVALRKLRMLNRSQTLQDLRVPPANRLERLTGNRTGQHSIRINNQWRICFVWRDGDAYEVEIVDYHQG